MDSSEVYGRLKVKYTSEENHEDFTVRKFQIGEDTPYLIPVTNIHGGTELDKHAAIIVM